MYLNIYLFIKQRPKSRYCRVHMHQCQKKREEGKKRKKSEEKERDQDTKGGHYQMIIEIYYFETVIRNYLYFLFR